MTEKYATPSPEDYNTSWRSREELSELGESLVPSYMQNTWQRSCEKYDLDDMNQVANILDDTLFGSRESALRTLEEDCSQNVFVLKSLAIFNPEGVDLLREHFTSVYGEISEGNNDFLNKCEKYHQEQVEKELAYKKQMGKMAIDDYEDIESLTPRERFKRRVHDDFGPEDARMIVYAKRAPAPFYASEDPDDWKHPDWGIYSTVTDVLPEMYNSGEQGVDSEKWDKWVEENYRTELMKTDRLLSWVMERSKERGDEERTQYCQDQVGRIRKILNKTSIKPTSSENGDPMWYQDGPGWLHCEDPISIITRYDVDARLYMHVKPDNLLDLVDAFKKKSNERKLGYYFKMTDEPRADNFLIFTSYENIDKHLAILREIQKESPELFEGMADGYKNPFWGKIDGAPKGVYFGEEPAQYPRAFEETAEELRRVEDGLEPDDVPFFMGYSYGDLRAEIFEIAFKKWIKETYGEEEIHYEYYLNGKVQEHPISFKSPEDIPLSAAKRLVQLFREECDKADVDPDNICFDKYPDKKRTSKRGN